MTRWLAPLLILLFPMAVTAEVTAARFVDPTSRYGHFALGPGLEWAAMEITLASGETRRITLPQTQVFEDNTPRLTDVDGDGDAEVIAVQSAVGQGARVTIWDEDGLVATNPFIGTANRWLAPVGAADLDGDGHVEIAYIDRPHLAKVLRVWRFADGTLTEIATQAGLTNHRFGEPEIWSGLRDCGQGWEMITADATWQQVIATRLTPSGLESEALGPYRDPASIETALNCDSVTD